MEHNHRPVRRRLAGLAVAPLVVGLLVVVGWSQPAGAADPTFTGGQVVAPYEGRASQSAVASNGTKALFVWHERIGTSNVWAVYGRISSADTTSIGPKLPIAVVAGKSSTYPDVAWSGNRWLVVFNYQYSPTDADIRGATVTPAGVVSGLINIEGNGANQYFPAVTGGKDGEFFVVWEDKRNAGSTLSDIYGRRITAAGAVDTDFPHHRLSYDLVGIQTEDTYPDVVYNAKIDVWSFVYEANGFGRSMLRYRDFTREILASGHVFADHDSAHPVSKPKIASDGRNMLMVYVDNKAPGLDLTGYVFGQDVDDRTIPITTVSNGNETQPAIAFNGNYLVAWKDTRKDGGGDIYGTRVKTDGTVVDGGSGFLITEFTPADEYPALGRGTTKGGTFTSSWNLNPGTGTGISGWGIDHPAPK
jgi:hypothetical protein